MFAGEKKQKILFGIQAETVESVQFLQFNFLSKSQGDRKEASERRDFAESEQTQTLQSGLIELADLLLSLNAMSILSIFAETINSSQSSTGWH